MSRNFNYGNDDYSEVYSHQQQNEYTHEDDGDSDTTTSNNDESSDDGSAIVIIGKKRKRNAQREEERTYGSFWEEDDEEEGRPSVSKRSTASVRNYDADANRKVGHLLMFVQGETLKNDEEENGREDLNKPVTATEEPPEISTSQNDESSAVHTDPEEIELQKQQQQANDYFHSLLQKAKKKSRSLSEIPSKMEVSAPSIPEPVAPAAFVQNNTQPNRNYPPPWKPFSQKPKPDPNLGKWEKHTKGIGAKLLAKMGYTGVGGLQEGKGISKPVQVKVRPANLGLGFGNFKEATHVNRSANSHSKQEGGIHDNESESLTPLALPPGISKSSLLPSTTDLMKKQLWRKRKEQNKKLKHEGVIPFQEVLEKKKVEIIDMRGKPITAASMAGEAGYSVDEAAPQPELGEELLHNISLLLNVYESRLFSANQIMEASKRKDEAQEKDRLAKKRAIEELEKREQKARTTLKLLDEIRHIHDFSSMESIESFQAKLKELRSNFSDEERLRMNFDDTVMPSLYKDALRSMIVEWNVLKVPIKKSRSILDLISKIIPDNNDDALLVLWEDQILPHVASAFSSSEWDPMRESEHAAELYDTIVEFSKEAITRMNNSGLSDDQILPFVEDHEGKMMKLARSLLIEKVIYPRLLNCVNRWVPSLSPNRHLSHPIHSWILPWIPHLADPSMNEAFQQLLSDCKSKLKSSISFLRKEVNDDKKFVQAAFTVLRPWNGILKPKSLESLSSSYIIPKAARVLSRMDISFEPQDMKWDILDSTIEMKNEGLISDDDFFGLIEGELMENLFTHCVSFQKKEKTFSVNKFIDFYLRWKLKLLGASSTKVTLAQNLLRNDNRICTFFNGLLLLLQAVADSKPLDDFYPASTTYKAVAARRFKERKREASDDIERLNHRKNDSTVETKIRLQRNQDSIPTFREVVEEFARERDLRFQPRTTGSHSVKDGKQVFWFGQTSIYLDKNVVFALRGGEWIPVSLDELARTEKSS